MNAERKSFTAVSAVFRRGAALQKMWEALP
jgi:hypothetical protein